MKQKLKPFLYGIVGIGLLLLILSSKVIAFIFLLGLFFLGIYIIEKYRENGK